MSTVKMAQKKEKTPRELELVGSNPIWILILHLAQV